MNAAKLKHVVEVDRCESISAAAKALNLTQSTVSRSVADIEREVGYSIFDRRARDVVATERGRLFINRAARIISDLDQLSEDARQSRVTSDTLIRVGISPPSMQGLVNNAIKHLVSRKPELRIHVEAVSAGSGVRALRRGDIDVLVGPENVIRGEEGFLFERLGDLETNLFIRKRHPLALKNTIRHQDIAAYPVIAPDRMSWHTDQLRKLFASHGGESARRMHIVEYFPLVADIVAGTDAIGVISAEYSTSKTFMRRFELLNVKFFEPLTIGFAVRKRWLPTPAVKAFQACLKEFPPGV